MGDQELENTYKDVYIFKKVSSDLDQSVPRASSELPKAFPELPQKSDLASMAQQILQICMQLIAQSGMYKNL
jgi:hypothetical protein